MKMRAILLITGLSLLLVGCGGDDSSNNGLSERDRAEAAASASVITGSLNDPEDPDDGGGGGSGSVPMAMMQGNSSLQMEPCQISGTVQSGTDQGVNVGSPYTADGTMPSINWTEYDNCVQGTTDQQYTYNGYTGIGTAETGAVTYSRWADARGSDVDLGGAFTLDFPDGQWSFAGEMHACDNCTMGSLFANEAYLDWVFTASVEGVEQTVNFTYGQSDDYFTVAGSQVAAGTVEQTVNGRFGIDWEGTPCDFEVDYETTENLVIQNFNTTSQVIASGRMNVHIPNGGTYNVRFENGDVYVDGELVDPNDNPCDGAFDIAA